uniref:Strictosidine synthase conserved region domain-containing protein n=1 Tax=Acrobeloides nanus TaxID=290746 RepID=A0A914DQG9_9BILA
MNEKNKRSLKNDQTSKIKPSRNFCSPKNIFLSIIVLLISLVISQKFSKFEPYTYSLPSPPKFEGPLAVNNILDNSELLLKDQILGPESLLIEGDTIYTGTEDGTIVKIVNGKIVKTIVLSNDKKCKSKEDRLKNGKLCGRPLGVRRLNKEELITADGFRGIVKINIEKETSEIVLPQGTIIEGKALTFADDLDVIDENTIVFSDATTKWDSENMMYDFLENAPHGRAIWFNIKTNETKILVDELFFANGVQIFPDKKSILIAETTMAKVTRYYLEGPKKGQRENFIENLPGVPDNIRLNSNGNFYIPLPAIRDPVKFDLREFLGPFPWVRRLMMQLIPISIMEKASISKYGLVVEVDQNGKILNSFHATNGDIYMITQASDDENYIYLGGYKAKFIARVQKPR